MQVFDFEKVKAARVNGQRRTRAFEVRECSRVRDLLKESGETYGTYLFVEFCHRYLRIFLIHGRSPKNVIEDAAFCILFIGLWRRDIDLRSKASAGQLGPKASTLQANCLSYQTCTDVLVTCNSVILGAMLFSKEYPKFVCDFGRMSSKFSEYVFQVSIRPSIQASVYALDC